MVELIYCSACRDWYEWENNIPREDCKCKRKLKFDNDYMTKVVKEIAEELTRKANVKNSRLG